MSAKLVVHKFESNIYSKSLQITIENGDNGSTRTIYSEWSEDSEGKTQHSKKDAQKSRLVVKIVSGNERTAFNLDSCSKTIYDTDTYTKNIFPVATFNDCYESNTIKNTVNTSTPGNVYKSDKNICSFGGYLIFKDENVIEGMKSNSSEHQQDMIRKSTLNSFGNSVSPLEYSLEKVKENNARIMQNIQILNRTLNYTKKKENFETACSKTMRYPCNSCDKCFVYKTGLKRHFSTRHAITESQPRWQVVWTCVECFQVWPQRDLAIEHSSQCCKTENVESVRDIKTSSLLQCEFCEKVFTSIPRLLRHSKIHTTGTNYECNACESSFVSYKDAEQHWLLCPWLRIYYSFSLPKNLLCNACDRKFRNYDQLYNHRYKVGHFITKTHVQGGVKSLGTLVYQCEICAQWFNSILLLQTHRTQSHSGYVCCDPEMQPQIQNMNFMEYDSACYKRDENDHHVSQMDKNHIDMPI